MSSENKRRIRISLSSKRGTVYHIASLAEKDLNGKMSTIISDFKETLPGIILPFVCLLTGLENKYPSGTLHIYVDNCEMGSIEIATMESETTKHNLDKIMLEMQVLSITLADQICKLLPHCICSSSLNVSVSTK